MQSRIVEHQEITLLQHMPRKADKGLRLRLAVVGQELTHHVVGIPLDPFLQAPMAKALQRKHAVSLVMAALVPRSIHGHADVAVRRHLKSELAHPSGCHKVHYAPGRQEGFVIADWSPGSAGSSHEHGHAG
jgi:hypothetical protein